MTTATDVEAYPSGPSAHGLDREYWEGLRRGELLAQRCASCRRWLGGPRAICSHCHSFDLVWEKAPSSGRVYTWCRTHYPYMTELSDLLPYVSVLAELPRADGIRLLGLLTADSDPVAIGDEVTAVIERPATAEWPVLRWRRTGGAERSDQ